MSAKQAKNQPPSMAQRASFVVLLVIIGIISVMFYMVMRSFLLPLFLAALTVVVFKPVHVWVLGKCRHRKLSALLTTIAVAVAIFGPISLCAFLAIEEGRETLRKEWKLDDQLVKLRTTFRLNIPAAPALNAVRDRFDSFITLNAQEEVVAVGTTPGDLVALQGELTQLRQSLERLSQEERDDATVQSTDPTVSASRYDVALTEVTEIEQAIAPLVELDLRHPEQLDQGEVREELLAQRAHYDSMRAKLLGGFPWSAAKELANPNQEEIDSWVEYLQKSVGKLTLSLSGRTPRVLVRTLLVIGIMLLSIFYFLLDGPEMVKTLMRLSPLDDEYENELVAEFDKVSRAVVLATLLSAVAQGLLAGVGYYLFGVPSIFLLTMLTAVLAMVPFVGAAAVWVPACLYLAFVVEPARTGAAIGLAIYGFAIVSMADNVIKPLVLHGQSNLHPLLALLSVLGGVQALGPVGILVGPMVVSFLQASLNILRKEMSSGKQHAA